MNTNTERIVDEPGYELINGEEIMMSPARPIHNWIAGNLHRILGNYIKGKRCKVYFDVYVLLGEERLAPDVFVVCDTNKIKDGYVEGAPDFVAEVLSISTQNRDLGVKKDIYEKHGVSEYWIIDPWNESITVYHLKDGKYRLENIYRNLSDKEIESYEDEKERSLIKLTLKIRLYNDLEISIRDIFE